MDLLEPLFDAIVQGEEHAVLNILRLSGDTSTIHTSEKSYNINNSNSPDKKIVGGKDIFELKVKDDACELIQLSDYNGKSALHWSACNSQSEKLTPMLIEKGAPIDLADSKGYTPLHLHSAMGRIYGVSSLLFYGADANCKNIINNITPIQLAEQHGHNEVVQILIAYGADNNKNNDISEKIS